MINENKQKMERSKQIGKISVVTEPKDWEDYGEINASFNQDELTYHIEKYGHQELTEKLAYLSWQVWQTVRDVNQKKGNENVGSN